MPKSEYIICAESGTVDNSTNQISIFRILEQIQVIPKAEAQDQGVPHSPLLSFKLFAVWKRTEGDPIAQYEYKTEMMPPGSDAWMTFSSGTFLFKATRHRFILDISGPLFRNRGELRIRNAIRQVDSNEAWFEQECSIQIELPGANAAITNPLPQQQA